MQLLYGFIIFLFSSACLSVGSQSTPVSVDVGNIYYVQDDHTNVQLPHSGHDRGPVISPDKKHIAFIYFIGGGSYDWYWLLTPEGKEIGPLGDESSIK